MVQSNLSLENIIIDEIVGAMSKELDNDIMRTCLASSGWTCVEFKYSNNTHATEVIKWLESSIGKTKWKRLNSYFVFANIEDAEWFMLRWM